MKLKIAPYKMGSQSAKLLARGLGVLRVREAYQPRESETLINWGRSHLSHTHGKVLNSSQAVALAANKLKTFQTLSDSDITAIPNWTTSKTDALTWISQGSKVYCRKTLTGKGGDGIVIASTPDELVDAPLYTQHANNKFEYRVHVFKGNSIHVQQKKKRTDWEGPATSGIRNHANGWVFAHIDITVPDIVITAAIKAVDSLGLDFGAVDIGYNETQNRAFIFEVNTAPGIEGTTLEKYVEAFDNFRRT